MQSRRAPALTSTCHDVRFDPLVGSHVNAGGNALVLKTSVENTPRTSIEKHLSWSSTAALQQRLGCAVTVSPHILIGPEPNLAVHARSPPAAGSHRPAGADSAAGQRKTHSSYPLSHSSLLNEKHRNTQQEPQAKYNLRTPASSNRYVSVAYLPTCHPYPIII